MNQLFARVKDEEIISVISNSIYFLHYPNGKNNMQMMRGSVFSDCVFQIRKENRIVVTTLKTKQSSTLVKPILICIYRIY